MKTTFSQYTVFAFLSLFLLLPTQIALSQSVFDCTSDGFALVEGACFNFFCTGQMETYECNDLPFDCPQNILEYCADTGNSSALAYVCHDPSCTGIGGYMQTNESYYDWQCVNTSCPYEIIENPLTWGVGWVCFNQSCPSYLNRYASYMEGDTLIPTDWSCDDGLCSDGLEWFPEGNRWTCNTANYQAGITDLNAQNSQLEDQIAQLETQLAQLEN